MAPRLHVSEMRNERVEKPTDVVSEGQAVKVKVLEIDPPWQGPPVHARRWPRNRRQVEDTRPPANPVKDRGPRWSRPRAVMAVVTVVPAVTVVAIVARAVMATVAVARVVSVGPQRGGNEGGGLPSCITGGDRL